MTPEKKPLSASLIARVAQGVRYAITGTTPDAWFGPGEPMAPQAQQVAGRQWDYDVAININYAPRGESASGISFEQLRGLADNYDVLRLAIETRKDQLGALDWTVQGIDGTPVDKAKLAAIKAFLRFPDGRHPFHTWTRLVLEDSFVIDAATLYPRLNRGGGLHALEVMDGATIKPLIDDTGRTPMAPNPAYQQVLHGIPAVDYSADELIYWPYNPRSSRLYAMSPVEQIIMTVNIALRRQVSTLQWYTEGNIPEALAGVPESWSAQQIKDFQGLFDQYLAGDTARRRRITFIPGGMTYHPTKDPKLKDEMDEWLARVVCFAFSLPATPFIKQVNRSQAEQAEATALQEGLAPRKQWLKGLLDYIIAKYFQAPDIEFVWAQGEQEQDPLTKAQIQQIYISAGVLSVNEVRADLGLEPNKEPVAPVTPTQTPEAADAPVSADHQG